MVKKVWQADRQTDRRTDWTIHRAAWSQLKIIGHLFYTTSSLVHHFKSISEFKLELQSGKTQFGSKSTIFFSCVTSQFDGWPWKTIGHLFYAISSFVHHFVVIGEFKLVLQSGNAQFGSNSTIFRAVWPWNFTYDLEQGKSEGFESCHRPIVRKRPIWVKIGDVLSRVTLKFDGWPWKTIEYLCFVVSRFVQHFIAIGEFKLELLSGNAQFESNSMIFRAVWHWNLTYDLEKQ